MKERWSTCLFLGSVVFLLFFSLGRAFHVPVENWHSDDGCYLRQLGDYIGIAGGEACGTENFYAPGAPLLWIVPGLIGKTIGHLLHESVTAWVLPWVAISSFLSWVLALFFVLSILESPRFREILCIARSFIALLALLILFNTFSLHYATARVFMAHSAEVMLAFGFVFMLLEDRLLPATLFALLLFVTRYNDGPAFVLLAAKLWERSEGKKPRRILLAGTAAAGALGIWFALFHGYRGETLLSVAAGTDWSSLRDFLVSQKWGLLWISPCWALCFFCGIARFRALSSLGKAALFWMASEAALSVLWGTGHDFANRYLIGSFAPALVVSLECLKSPRVGRRARRALFGMLAVNGAWVILMTMLYQTSPGTSPDLVNGVCVMPVDLTKTLFLNLLDGTAYRLALLRQVVPVTLFFSRYPDMLPAGVGLEPLNSIDLRMGYAGMVFATGYCIFYLVFLKKRDSTERI